MTKAEALEGSIQKWQDIVDGKAIDLGGHNCPLCKLYADNYCKDCPVYPHTPVICNENGVPSDRRKGDCRGTPYIDFVRARSYIPAVNGRVPWHDGDGYDFDALGNPGTMMKIAAVAELNFLKSLRDE